MEININQLFAELGKMHVQLSVLEEQNRLLLEKLKINEQGASLSKEENVGNS